MQTDNKISDSIPSSNNEYICPNCVKNFSTVAAYEMHVKYCVKEDDPSKWENFGNNFNHIENNIDNHGYNINNYSINSDINLNYSHQDIDNNSDINGNNDIYKVANQNVNEINYNEGFHDNQVDNYNANESYHSATVSDHDQYQHENFENDIGIFGVDYINFNEYNQPNLNYEQLIQLDENIKHPLDDFFISMLITEKLQSNTVSHLSGDSKKCLICFDDFEANQNIIRLPCFHIFHDTEITHWFESNKTCPTCRVDIEELLSKY